MTSHQHFDNLRLYTKNISFFFVFQNPKKKIKILSIVMK